MTDINLIREISKHICWEFNRVRGSLEIICHVSGIGGMHFYYGQRAISQHIITLACRNGELVPHRLLGHRGPHEPFLLSDPLVFDRLRRWLWPDVDHPKMVGQEITDADRST